MWEFPAQGSNPCPCSGSAVLTIGPPGKSLNRLFIQTFKFSIFPKFVVSMLSCDHIISHLWKDTKKKQRGRDQRERSKQR